MPKANNAVLALKVAAICTSLAACSDGGSLQGFDANDETSSGMTVKATELLSNGGFESGFATPWQAWGSSYAAAGQASSGTYAAHIGKGSGAGQNVYGLTPGTAYTYSAAGKAATGGGPFHIGVKFYASNNTQIGSASYGTPFATTYGTRSVDFVFPQGAHFAQMFIWNDSNGTAYFDEASLVAGNGAAADSTAPASSAGSADNLLDNAGLETGSVNPWTPWGSFVTDRSGHARSGSYAAHAPSNNGAGQIVSVTPGQTYTYSASGKIVAGSGSGKLTAKFMNNAYQQVGSEKVSPGFGGSHSVQSITLQVPAGATRVQLGLWNSSNGSFYIDDFYFGTGTAPSADSGSSSGSSSGGATDSGSSTGQQTNNDSTESTAEAAAEATPAATPGPNMIDNGTFESNALNPWQAWGSLSIDGSGNAYGGTYALKVNSGNGGGQYINITAGSRYVYSGFGKTNGGSARLTAKYLNNAWAQVGSEVISDTFGSSYSQQSVTLTPPAGATMIQAGFWNAGSAPLFLDDVQLAAADTGGGNTTTGSSGGSTGGSTGGATDNNSTTGDTVVSEADTGANDNVTAGSCPAVSKPAGLTLASASNPITVPQDFLGMHVSPNDAWTGNPVPAPTYNYGYVRNLKVGTGQSLAERGFWSNIEKSYSGPGQPGNYDWSAVDTWIQATAPHPVIWMIYGTPDFYKKYWEDNADFWGGSVNRSANSAPADDKHYALERFVKAVKARYGNRIKAFEVWNEPTFSYSSGPNDYTYRCSTNDPDCPARKFFNGTPQDLANIAFTLKKANLGVPVLGAGFVDQWAGGSHSVTRFLNAPISLPGAGGRGKDYIDALSVHFYDYSRNPSNMQVALAGYRSKLSAAGVPNMPLWVSEVAAEDGGRFGQYDPQAPVSIRRWAMIAAAMGAQSHVLYAHSRPTDAIAMLSDPINNQAVINSINDAYALGGKTICDAVLKPSGEVWISTRQSGVIQH